MAESPGAVVVAHCRVEVETEAKIIHVMGAVENQTGQAVTGVTVRYGVFQSASTDIPTPASISDRRGQLINENTLAAGATGQFNRRDQPIKEPSGDWFVLIEGIDWQENGKAKSYVLPKPLRCGS